jgi:hypothetical protein
MQIAIPAFPFQDVATSFLVEVAHEKMQHKDTDNFSCHGRR